MGNAEELAAGAQEWLAAAEANLGSGRLHVAFEEARHAAELAAKARLAAAGHEFPKTHDVSGLLFQKGLVPASIEPKALARLLSAFTMGSYGFDKTVTEADVRRAIQIAQALVSSGGRT